MKDLDIEALIAYAQSWEIPGRPGMYYKDGKNFISRIKNKEEEPIKKQKSIKIKFGKYKGLTIEELLQKDLSYYNWVIRETKDNKLKDKMISLMNGKK
jgi:hypothetical protein